MSNPADQAQPCPACGAPILWALDGRGHSTPVDAQSSGEGTLSLSATWDDKLLAVKPTAKLAFGRANLHVLHRATCGNLAKPRTIP